MSEHFATKFHMVVQFYSISENMFWPLDIEAWGWRDGLVVKGTDCSRFGLFASQQLTTTCNSSSIRPNTSSDLHSLRHTCDAYTHTQPHTHIHIPKLNKQISKSLDLEVHKLC